MSRDWPPSACGKLTARQPRESGVARLKWASFGVSRRLPRKDDPPGCLRARHGNHPGARSPENRERRGMLLRARKRLQIGQQYRAILGSQIV